MPLEAVVVYSLVHSERINHSQRHCLEKAFNRDVFQYSFKWNQIPIL